MVLLRARDAAAVQASMAHPVASRVSDRLRPRGHIFEKSSSCSSLRWPTVLQLRMRPCRTWTSTWTAGASPRDSLAAWPRVIAAGSGLAESD